MNRIPLSTLSMSLALVVASSLIGPRVQAADYKLDAGHSSVVFKIQHVGISWTFGRFNDVSGDFTIDKETPSNSKFSFEILAGSIDTNNAQRDTHLKSDDFFDVKQFPKITFKSSEVHAHGSTLHVNGNLTMHGQTHPISFHLKYLGEAEFHGQRIGFETDLVLKRSGFGIGGEKFEKALGDDVHVMISFEGIEK